MPFSKISVKYHEKIDEKGLHKEIEDDILILAPLMWPPSSSLRSEQRRERTARIKGKTGKTEKTKES